MTVFLDVIAVCRVDEAPVPIEPEDALPVTPAPSGVFLIHVAPSPRLDPSKPEDVQIVDADLGDETLNGFIVD